MKKKIGLVGFGVIGSYIFRRVQEEKLIEVGFIYEADHVKTEQVDPPLLLHSFDDFNKRTVDLVVEVANSQAVRDFGPRILKKSDFLIFSLCSLANKSLQQEMESTARKSGTIIYIPHGAIVGLDGIRDGRKVIEEVHITTTKNPRNLDIGAQSKEVTQPTVLYEGPTRGACYRFPKNVNTHASIALAGLGLDKTQSKIIADPNTNKMTHIVEVVGQGLHWQIQVESIPSGAVTGAYTPESAYQTVKRICVQGGGFQLV